MGYDYDYDDEAPYGSRILWGRIAVFGVVLVLVFALGSWWGGRGAVDDGQLVELQAEVDTLEARNRELQDTIDAMSAGEPEEQPEEQPEADAEDAAEPEPETNTGEEPRTYLVQPGDTLRGIAAEVYGDPDEWEVIAEANGLTRETVLTVGQELVIPPLNGNDGGDA